MPLLGEKNYSTSVPTAAARHIEYATHIATRSTNHR